MTMTYADNHPFSPNYEGTVWRQVQTQTSRSARINQAIGRVAAPGVMAQLTLAARQRAMGEKTGFDREPLHLGRSNDADIGRAGRLRRVSQLAPKEVTA